MWHRGNPLPWQYHRPCDGSPSCLLLVHQRLSQHAGKCPRLCTHVSHGMSLASISARSLCPAAYCCIGGMAMFATLQGNTAFIYAPDHRLRVGQRSISTEFTSSHHLCLPLWCSWCYSSHDPHTAGLPHTHVNPTHHPELAGQNPSLTHLIHAASKLLLARQPAQHSTVGSCE
jgi:hypothetical protein